MAQSTGFISNVGENWVLSESIWEMSVYERSVAATGPGGCEFAKIRLASYYISSPFGRCDVRTEALSTTTTCLIF